MTASLPVTVVVRVGEAILAARRCLGNYRVASDAGGRIMPGTRLGIAAAPRPAGKTSTAPGRKTLEDRMAKKILFVGAGAIGSYIGSFLSRAGHDVTLVDPWAEQVETIRKKGISVTGPHDPFEAHPKAFHLGESQRLPRDFDLAFVAMKVYDTPWAAQVALRHIKPEGF